MKKRDALKKPKGTPSRTEVARHRNADSGDDMCRLHVENTFPVWEVTQQTSYLFAVCLCSRGVGGCTVP